MMWGATVQEQNGSQQIIGTDWRNRAVIRDFTAGSAVGLDPDSRHAARDQSLRASSSRERSHDYSRRTAAGSMAAAQHVGDARNEKQQECDGYMDEYRRTHADEQFCDPVRGAGTDAPSSDRASHGTASGRARAEAEKKDRP